MLALRRLRPDDVDLVYAWRNDPFVAAPGGRRKPVTADEHRSWFEHVLANPDSLLFAVEVDGQAAGQVRFERHGPNVAEITIALLAPFTGRGLGVDAIRHGCGEAAAAWPELQRVLAQVLTENRPALAAFAKAGFVTSGLPASDGLRLFSWRRPEARRRKASKSRGQSPAEGMASSPNVPHNRLTFGEAEVRAAAQAVQSGEWSCGARTLALEADLAQRFAYPQAVAVGSGLAALRLGLKALGVGDGAEVLIPAYASVALANAVLALGAKPVVVDVRAADWNMDVAAAAAALTRRTRAIVAVNTFGAPAPVAALEALGPPVIEDRAHGFALGPDDDPIGPQGTLAIFSFCAHKLVGGGEGGAILSYNDGIGAALRAWRDYANQPPDGGRLNDKMSDIEAAVVGCQLARLPEVIAGRRKLALRYIAELAPVVEATGAFRLPTPSPDRIWYRFAVELLGRDPLAVRTAMRRRGVAAELPVGPWLDLKRFPVAAGAYSRLLSLPLYPTLRPDEQDSVCRVFAAAL
jgi:dTDP-4-amino-4,6-dideoxygalactose transaminase/RimJ/RimL family protein N-acetyltransferase